MPRLLRPAATCSALAVLTGTGLAAAFLAPDPNWSAADAPPALVDAPPSIEADAELLAACAELEARERRLSAHPIRFMLLEAPGYDALEAEADSLAEASIAVVDQVCALPATTLEGHRARARALVAFTGEDPENESASSYPVERLFGALLRDLVRPA